MNALAGAAPAFVFALIERHGIACEARQQGTLRAAVHASHAARIRHSTDQWRRRDAPVELLTGAALAAATGTERYLIAMLDRRGGDLNPLSFARGLARAAVRAGAVVYGGTRATKLTAGGRLWKVATSAGTTTAEHVVLATNGYTDDLWPGLRRSVVPLFGAMAATAPLSDTLARAVMPRRCVLYESGAVTVYYRVDRAQRLLMGGRGPLREVTTTACIAHLPAYAQKLWPGLRGTRWTHAWGGRLAMTRDHYPHIHEPARGVIACLGYNGRGVAMSTMMGAQLAQHIVEPSAAFNMPLTDVKTIGLHSWWPLAVRAATARGRMADHLGL